MCKALTLFMLGSCVIPLKTIKSMKMIQKESKQHVALTHAELRKGRGRRQSCWSSKHVNFGKELPQMISRSTNSWTNSASSSVSHGQTPSWIQKAKCKWNPLHLLFPSWAHSEPLTLCWEICRNTCEVAISATLDQKCGLVSAWHASEQTARSWVLQDAMPLGVKNKLGLSPCGTCWLPCLHQLEKTWKTLVVQDSPNTVWISSWEHQHSQGSFRNL